jgi:hypothetical protein
VTQARVATRINAIYSSAKSSIIISGVTARGATLSAGMIDSKARFKPAQDSRKVCA